MKKARQLQHQWYQNYRAYLVEARRVELLSESTSSRTSPGAVILLEFPLLHAK